jgi:hypothetical protein
MDFVGDIDQPNRHGTDFATRLNGLSWPLFLYLKWGMCEVVNV